MAKTPDRQKYPNTITDKRRFTKRLNSESCAECIGVNKTNASRGACCIRRTDMGSNPATCPRSYNCWECISQTTECECAMLGGDTNCINPKGNWKWRGGASSCEDCVCHNPDIFNLQVVTPGCHHHPGTLQNPCCMDVWNKNEGFVGISPEELKLYKPYDIKNNATVKECRCGCTDNSRGDIPCGDSSENQLNAIPSLAGGVSPIQVKFMRRESYLEKEHSIYDKYAERFRKLLYSKRSGHLQRVRYKFAMKRYMVEGENGRGIESGKRYDGTDLILRVKYAPGAEIPINPRQSDGSTLYSKEKWYNAKTGNVQDVPSDHHVIDIPFNATSDVGIGDITIPIKPQYNTKFKVLKFDLQIIDAETGYVLSKFDKGAYNKYDNTEEKNYQSFIGYQDCLYSGKECYSYETYWDSIYVILDGEY